MSRQYSLAGFGPKIGIHGWRGRFRLAIALELKHRRGDGLVQRGLKVNEPAVGFLKFQFGRGLACLQNTFRQPNGLLQVLLVGVQIVLEFILNLLGFHTRVIFDVLQIQSRPVFGGVGLLLISMIAFTYTRLVLRINLIHPKLMARHFRLPHG